MKNTTHRVVILKDVNSAIISQAILILKNSDGVCEAAVLEEAERVVEKYMKSAPSLKDKNDGVFMISLLSMAAIIFISVCVFTVFKIF